MGTRGLQIVRFRKRYYIQYNQFDSYFDGLGAKIVAGIPSDSEEYQVWLKSMRDKYLAREHAIEQYAGEIRDGPEPDDSLLRELETLPSELPRLNGYDAEYFYIINLDQEVLTMNHSIHWKLGNIPRRDNLWLRAIKKSIYRFESTISPDICPEEHMASPALDLSQPVWEVGYDFRTVSPKTNIEGAGRVLLTRVLAEALLGYKDEIIRFGAEWSPNSFPFRELAFALVSIASGQAGFYSLPAQRCSPRGCPFWDCEKDHLPQMRGWLDEKWAGDKAPLLEFGSMSHRPGDGPGVSPAETTYWLEDVLVSLSLVVDGEAITNAATWGIEQGRTAFQMVVLSLFEVAFAEVSLEDGAPFLKVAQPIALSPLRAAYCLSTHPRERPVLKPGTSRQGRRGNLIMQSNCTGTARRLRQQFPGLVALINFFDIAASRRATFKGGFFPTELYSRILDFVDYDTWKVCLLVSRELRSSCLLKYRLDDRLRIVAGPFVRLHKHHKGRVLSFDCENMQTGDILPMVQIQKPYLTREWSWMPVIGRDRRAVMLDTVIQFDLAGQVPVEADSDDECP